MDVGVIHGRFSPYRDPGSLVPAFAFARHSSPTPCRVPGDSRKESLDRRRQSLLGAVQRAIDERTTLLGHPGLSIPHAHLTTPVMYADPLDPTRPFVKQAVRDTQAWLSTTRSMVGVTIGKGHIALPNPSSGLPVAYVQVTLMTPRPDNRTVTRPGVLVRARVTTERSPAGSSPHNFSVHIVQDPASEAVVCVAIESQAALRLYVLGNDADGSGDPTPVADLAVDDRLAAYVQETARRLAAASVHVPGSVTTTVCRTVVGLRAGLYGIPTFACTPLFAVAVRCSEHNMLAIWNDLIKPMLACGLHVTCAHLGEPWSAVAKPGDSSIYQARLPPSMPALDDLRAPSFLHAICHAVALLRPVVSAEARMGLTDASAPNTALMTALVTSDTWRGTDAATRGRHMSAFPNMELQPTASLVNAHHAAIEPRATTTNPTAFVHGCGSSASTSTSLHAMEARAARLKRFAPVSL